MQHLTGSLRIRIAAGLAIALVVSGAAPALGVGAMVVAAPPGTFTRAVQRFVRPAWNYFGDGCHPDRETWESIESAGFSSVHLDHFRIPSPIVAPHIRGFALK